MSRASDGNPAWAVQHGEELEPAICSALTSLLATEPTPAEVDRAMMHLRSARDSLASPVQTSVPLTSTYSSTSPWLLATASLFVFCLCGIASTEGWAQVAKNFADPVNEPRPLSELAEGTSDSSHQARDMGFGLRLLLIAHISVLMLGLGGMVVTWLIAVSGCFLDHWRKSRSGGASTSTPLKILFSSAILYTVGIILGAIWAQATWGRFWSWDPRETFGLFTLAFAVLWMKTLDKPVRSEPESCRFSAVSASIATIALGAIVLMHVLGNRYAAALHSYGVPALSLPNVVFGLFAGCLVTIWISCALCTRISRKTCAA